MTRQDGSLKAKNEITADRRKTVNEADKMGQMPVGRLIVSMSWPAILSMFIQALYNVVDSFFVSLLSEQALAAVTYIFPVQMLLISVSVGTGVGINSLISRRLGAGRVDEAEFCSKPRVQAGILQLDVFRTHRYFPVSTFMKLMSDTPYIVENGTVYMMIITILSLFSIIQITTEKILQATGNMKMPMMCSIVGAAVNIAFDPILIFGAGLSLKWALQALQLQRYSVSLFPCVWGR